LNSSVAVFITARKEAYAMEQQSIVVIFGNEKTVLTWPTGHENCVPQIQVTFANAQEEQTVSSFGKAKG
jgi:hypothetical protein